MDCFAPLAMTAVGLGERAFNYAQRFRTHHCHRPARPDDPVRRAVRNSITTVCGILDAQPARVIASVIASVAKQSTLPLALDGLLRSARNDVCRLGRASVQLHAPLCGTHRGA